MNGGADALKPWMARMPPLCGQNTTGEPYWCTNRFALVADSFGKYRSSSGCTTSVNFFPFTVMPPPSLMSAIAISMPSRTLRPYNAAPPLNGPVNPIVTVSPPPVDEAHPETRTVRRTAASARVCIIVLLPNS